MSYTGTIQAKWLDGTPYPYPHVKVYVYREDWKLPFNISRPLQPLKISIVQFIKVGDKNGNIIFQVSDWTLFSYHHTLSETTLIVL